MNLKTQVEKILFDRREFERSAGFSNPKERDVIQDYAHFCQLVDSTLIAVPSCKRFVSFGNAESEQNAFIISSVIAYNLRFYDALSSNELKIREHFMADGSNSLMEINFILLWKQNVFSMVSAFSLAKDSLHFQSMQLIRGYIESSAILYLAMISPGFFKKYSSNGVSREEYMKLWFKELKPSKVTKAIQDIHSKWQDEDRVNNVRHIGIRSISEKLFTESHISKIYEETSDFMHFNKSALLMSATGDKPEHLYIGVREGSKDKQLEIYLIMVSLFPLLSGLLEMCAASWNVVRYNQLMGDFSEVVKGLKPSSII